MKTSLARRLAEEFINVLKYNPQLSHDDKVLSLELRLDKLVEDVEKLDAELGRVHAPFPGHDVPEGARPYDVLRQWLSLGVQFAAEVVVVALDGFQAAADLALGHDGSIHFSASHTFWVNTREVEE